MSPAGIVRSGVGLWACNTQNLIVNHLLLSLLHHRYLALALVSKGNEDFEQYVEALRRALTVQEQLLSKIRGIYACALTFIYALKLPTKRLPA